MKHDQMTEPVNDQARDTYEHELPLRYRDASPTGEDEAVVGADREKAPKLSSRFNADNAEAVPVFERACTSFALTTKFVTKTEVLVGRRRGRRAITVSCPTAYRNAAGALTVRGFQVSHDRNNIDQGVGVQLNPGDSWRIESEAEVYIGLLPSYGAEGVNIAQYEELFNVLGGPAST